MCDPERPESHQIEHAKDIFEQIIEYCEPTQTLAKNRNERVTKESTLFDSHTNTHPHKTSFCNTSLNIWEILTSSMSYPTLPTLRIGISSGRENLSRGWLVSRIS